MTASSDVIVDATADFSTRILWQNSQPEKARIHEFMSLVNSKYKCHLSTYADLYQWSLDNLSTFWEEVWHFTSIRASTPFTTALNGSLPMFPRPPFFSGATLNFAENLLYPASNPAPDATAVITVTEMSRKFVTWSELRDRVRRCAAALVCLGVGKMAKVAGYLANHTDTVVAMLAATSLGAIWTGISPDTGVYAVLDRLRQIEPNILFADNATIYNGKLHETHEKLKDIVKELPSLDALVVFDNVKGVTVEFEDLEIGRGKGKAWKFEDLLKSIDADANPGFKQLPADHPVYILYSSGTTGAPKCIVHGAIGTLIQHKKEHDLQCDIRPGDRILYFTTCTWMMWHWLISALAVGATVVLYEGSPFRSLDESGPAELAMPRLIEELDINHFGTSAKYLSMLEQKSIMPKEHSLPMKHLRAIYSTGSPLAPSTFEYIYEAFGPDIMLGSITGGTDIISLFGAPSPISPVHQGEVMVRGLGMAVQVWDMDGENITATGKAGELVCVKPFPCQPVMFWGPDGEQRYRSSYFEFFGPRVWHHGDYIRINPQTGGLKMLGRSDGVLKPAGVRFGSSEIYNVLVEFFPQIEDALCIGRRRDTDTDEVVILFLRMADGYPFSDTLAAQVKERIRLELSARHVPSIIEKCPEIPVTANGKKVENAVKHILSGTNIKTSASVANVECLEFYRQWAREHA